MRVESGSSLATFRTCKKLYKFKYEDLLGSRGYSSALGFGTFVHLGVEARNAGKETEAPLELAKTLAKYPDQGEQITFDFEIAMGVVSIWYQYWSGQAGNLGQKNLEFLDVEEEWAYPVGLDIHVGKRDGYLKHTGLGAHFLYELKTASASSDSNYIHRLMLDHQISSNVIALESDMKPVDGVFYDVIWKHALRQKKTESLVEFKARILQDYMANASEYFTRVLVDRTPKHLVEYFDELKAQFAELNTGERYRNPSACMQYGRLCEFFNICMDDDVPELRAQFKVRENKFPELTEANAMISRHG